MPSLPLLLLVLIASSISYRDLTTPSKLKAFYDCGGRSHSGDRVHLHVPAARLLAAPKIAETPAGQRLLVFKNETVPLLVAPGSVYYRKLKDRVDPGDRVCVKGKVSQQPLAGKGRCAIFVHTLKKAPEGSSD